MDRLIYFRFHDHAAVCANHVRFLKHLNPEVPIFGFGEWIDGVRSIRAAGLEHVYVIGNEDSRWKWKNGDLALRRWFDAVGHRLEFDVVHVVDWDLLYLRSLDDLFGDLGADGVAVSGKSAIDDAIEWGWNWAPTGEDEQSREYRRLREHVAEELGYEGETYACIGPGMTLSRAFLEDYAACAVPEYSNEEVRVPLFAHALGYDVEDTGLTEIFGYHEDEYFNAMNREVDVETARAMVERPDGRDALHPMREVFPEDAWPPGPSR